MRHIFLQRLPAACRQIDQDAIQLFIHATKINPCNSLTHMSAEVANLFLEATINGDTRSKRRARIIS